MLYFSEKHNKKEEKKMEPGRNSDNGMEKQVLLYIYPSATSFIRQDSVFFSEYFSVKTFSFLPGHKLLLPFSFLKQKLFLLANIRSASILVCQFAGYQSFLPVLFAKIFHRPCLIVVGGTDCVSFPSINYGNLRKPLLKWFTLKSLKQATHITAPSISLVEYDYTYHNRDYPSQGYRFFDKSINTPYTIIYNGIDTNRFCPVEGVIRRKKSFLTICNYIDKRNFLLKGLDLFIEAARNYPECEFTVIGKLSGDFHFVKPENVTLIGFIPNEQLPSKISEYTYYCQLSVSEGFGVALAEAMATGCVPVVSRVGILDYITGDTGFILDKYDPDLLKSVIASALQANVGSLSGKARERIVANFNDNIRKDRFRNLFNYLLRNE